jgi:phosphate acetyltransferase
MDFQSQTVMSSLTSTQSKSDHAQRPTVFLYSPEDGTGRDTIALGLLHALRSAYPSCQPFQPIVGPGSTSMKTLLESFSPHVEPSLSDIHARQGSTLDDIHHDFAESELRIVARIHESELLSSADALLCVGSNRSASSDPYLLADNAIVAADLGASVFICFDGTGLTASQIAHMVRSHRHFVESHGAHVIGVFICPGDPNIRREVLIRLVDDELPIWFVPSPALDSHDTRHAQIAAQLDTWTHAVNEKDVLAAIHTPTHPTITPARFQYEILAKARENKQRIVLPEGDDDRILTAANYLLEHNIIHATIMGNPDQIRRHAHALGLDSIDRAQLVSLDDPHLLEQMIPELVRLRSSHGVDEQAARKLLTDPSYFGTMYVQLGLADGMVSGARHSTANTVRPGLQIIRAKEDVPIVSGAMVMCLPRRVDLYADVALLISPTASQLATVAQESAHTAETLGIRPIVGMLSYSTGTSGKGPDVDLVREATEIVRQRDPSLAITGPIQFDAAWDSSVAAMKAPGDPAAGRVNVFVLPDLSASNVAVKAVQRIGGGIAIGPILQGLKKPVNDLSRGATTRDIINTIALTAVMAQKNN